MNVQFVVFSTNRKLIEQLKAYAPQLPFLRYVWGDGPKATAEAALDAIWVSPMAAVDRFGANPPFPLFQAVVIKTPSSEVKRGLPRYGIAGVAVPKDHPQDPLRDLEIKVSALLKAIQDFNKKGEDRILRVGLLPGDLGMDKLAPATAFQIIDRIYGELIPNR
jgi:hypothetical protein